MLTISNRAANDLDLTTMTRGRGDLRGNLATVSVPAGIVAGGLTYAFSRSWWIAVATGVGLFSMSLYSNLMFFRGVKSRAVLKGDSKSVEVLAASADRVLDVEPVGDNAPAYCFFLGERKALLLVGQWLLQYPSFPSKTFSLHLWSETKSPIRIDVTGPTIVPEHSNVQLRTGHRVQRVQLLDASPETLQADLDSVLGRVAEPSR